MSQNWWEDAPLASDVKAAPTKNWWDDAPVAGAPEAKALTSGGRADGALNAAARGLVDGVPVVGPYLLSGIDKADAAVRAATNDSRYSDEAAKARDYDAQMRTEHPYATTAGEVAGGVVGTAPLILAAPAAFGAGAGGLAARSAASMVSGAVLGGSDAAVRSGGDVNAAGKGMIAGAAFGGAAPAVGSIVGAGARRVAEAAGAQMASTAGYGSAAIGKLAEDTRNAGGVGQVRTRLGELGPEAMLLDASPSFEGRAQGLAVLPDTRETITRPLQTRAARSNARLAADVDAQLGPAMDPAAFHAALDTHYAQTVPPLYQQALGQPVQVDTSRILDTIGRLGEAEKGGAATALGRAWNLLHAEQDVPGVGRAMVPDRRPEALHNAKEALDGMIASAQNAQGLAAASEVRALSAVRAGVNDALEAQVPGYRDANRTAQHVFQQRDAFDQGQRLLNAGRETARPAQVAADTAAMTPEVQQAQRLGLRAEVDRAVGTQLNDRLALRGALMGEGDFNRARMGTVFGEQPTAGIASAIDREAAFDASNNRIVNNSMTELRRRAADDVAPREKFGEDATAAIAGAVAGPQAAAAVYGMKGAKAGLSAAARQQDLARNCRIAEALVQRQGEEVNRLLAAIALRQTTNQGAAQFGRAAQVGAQAGTISQADRSRGYTPFGLVSALR